LAEQHICNSELAAVLERHAAWWRREAPLLTRVEGTPLGDLWLPLADGTLAAEDVDLTPELLDVHRLAGERQSPGPLEVFGDRICTADPFSRMPWVEAILGAPVRATIRGGSMRTRPFIRTWQEWERAPTRRDEGWFSLLMRLTDMLVERSGGRRAATAPILRGPCDMAEAVLGPELTLVLAARGGSHSGRRAATRHPDHAGVAAERAVAGRDAADPAPHPGFQAPAA